MPPSAETIERPPLQAEKTITMGFYTAPLSPLTGRTLEGVFRQADVFGCAPKPEKADYIQKVP